MSNNLEIEILYFEDCPSWKQAVDIMESVLRDLDIDAYDALAIPGGFEPPGFYDDA